MYTALNCTNTKPMWTTQYSQNQTVEDDENTLEILRTEVENAVKHLKDNRTPGIEKKLFGCSSIRVKF